METTVVIPAFNEESGIGAALDRLLRSPDSGPDIEVIVAANGCTDRTAEIARQFGARVIEIATPSKTAAMNAADAAATSFPRVYLDADISASPALIRALADAVSTPGINAAVPRQVFDLSRSSWPVRAYYAVHGRLPVFEGRVFGRGQVVALSKEARSRFTTFIETDADDLFLDAMVAPEETKIVDQSIVVNLPRTVGDLVKRLARSREANARFYRWVVHAEASGVALRAPVRESRRWSWLHDVVLPAPRLWPAGVCFAAVTLAAEVRRRSPGWSSRSGWGRPPT